MKVWVHAISMVTVAVLLAACGGDGNGGATPGNTITMTNNQFTPSDVTISAGAVTLKNDGSALHNVSVEGQNIDQDVPAGEAETEDFELEAGSYTFFRKYHRDQGMEGTLTIA
jgi:plastocyanin